MTTTAAEMARRIHEEFPDTMTADEIRDFVVRKFPDAKISDFKRALDILIEIEDQDIAEYEAAGRAR